MNRRAVLAFAASLAPAPAVADGVQRIDSIEVSGHYDNRVGSSDAASAGIITRQLIDDRPLLRPGSLLEYVPGMVVTQHSGAGKANQYFLRGFNLDHGTDFRDVGRRDAGQLCVPMAMARATPTSTSSFRSSSTASTTGRDRTSRTSAISVPPAARTCITPKI